ncbi:uncharacterized protein HGUI_00048 [Hanseniaspora guilliermondii]|uniref:RRM domain-containing protein n=1 Tax=Hanseniaspora guilliermondii TaxID=56406 RepID=A0A1L0AUR4_9ASCO|nr:uncharacterized protein HGUI_00048 [Hanseniaspora guilliermondii]
MLELLLLTVSHESESKTEKFQFQYTSPKGISINDSKFLGQLTLPKRNFSFDCFFSIQKVIISQPSHLIIKNIKKDDLEELKHTLEEFGEISNLRMVDDCFEKDNCICFVNFVNEKDAFMCIETVTNQHKWFANYHIERLERDKTQLLESKQECDENEFKKVYVSLQNVPEHKKVVKQMKTHNVEVLLSPFDSIKDGLSITQFDGFNLFLNVCNILMEKNVVCNISSFTYNHGYFLMKFDDHGQALDCIKYLDESTVKFKNTEICLKPQRANVRKSFLKGKKDSITSEAIKFNSYQTESMSELFKNRSSLRNMSLYSNGHDDSRSNSVSSASCSPKFKGFNEVESATSIEMSATPLKDSLTFANSFSDFNENVFQNNEYVPVPIPIPYPIMMGPMNPFQIPPPFLNLGIKPPTYYNAASMKMYNYPFNSTAPVDKGNKSINWSYPIPSSIHQHSNLYFQNLPFSWTDKELFEFVASYLEQIENMKDPESEIISYKVITQNFHEHQAKGSSKGYGFVSFSNPLVASKCAYYLDMYELDPCEYDDVKDKQPLSDSTNDENRYKLKVSFAMKRGRSLEIAKSKPIVMNKQFIECLTKAI